MATPEALVQLPQLVHEPPHYKAAQLGTLGRVGLIGLGHESHEAETPTPILPAQRFKFSAMLMKNQVLGLIYQRVARPNHAVEDVQVAASGERFSGIQSLVKAAKSP